MNRSNYECYPNPDGTMGWVWNPITGSLDDCPNPNARRLAHGRLKERYLANRNLPPDARVSAKLSFREGTAELGGAYSDPFYPRFWPERMSDIPRQHGVKPKGIFPCDMSDLFGIGIPEAWTWSVLNLIKVCSQHRFYLLTKQPQNLLQWSPFPDNCWVGVTITSEDMINPAYWGLSKVKAKVKYLSIEPLLHWKTQAEHWSFRLDFIDWLIIGAQTKPYKPPKIEWVKEIVEAADKAGIPVFLKDNLKPIIPQPISIRFGSLDRGLRQEMPQV